MDWFRRSVGSFQTAWSGFPVSYRVLTGFLLVLLALVSVWGVTAAGRDGWVRIVDGRRAIDQRAQIVSKLRELGIKTKVDGDGISVSTSQADEAMLQLHSSGVLGDEAFFKFLKESDLFDTREKSDRKWLVAIQGRLAAVIQSLEYVERACVQIAEPDDPKRLWWSNGREATAAVILTLEPGQQMSVSRVRGIASIVAAARPDIKPLNVKILDTTGQFFRVPDAGSIVSQDLRDLEYQEASKIEEKALRLLPPDSRVAAQVRLNADDRKLDRKTVEPTPDGAVPKTREVDQDQESGEALVVRKEARKNPTDQDNAYTHERRSLEAGANIESISISALIPDAAPGVPAGSRDRAEYIREKRDLLRTATGAKPEDISIQIGSLSIAMPTGAVEASAPAPAGFRPPGPLLLLGAIGFVALAAAYRLVRGMAPVTDNGVVAEESLRSPGESILSAQDEVLDRIRDGVRDSVTRNPREAADVARRWLSP